MAKRCSAQRTLQLILEEREASDDDVEEEASECEDHIFDNDFEEEDEIEHELVPKWRRATGLACQQPASGPTRQRKARMWYSWVHCTGIEESVARSIKNQRASWIMMSRKEGWTTWTSWWLPTAAKGGPYTGHWWYSLTYWTSQRTMPTGKALVRSQI